MERVYNKLVRDNIPNIIKEKEETAVVRVLDDVQYEKELKRKLYEEVKEVDEASDNELLEELADVLEVIRALAKLANKDLNDVIAAADLKKEKRGAFDKQIFLEKVVQK